MKGKVWTEIEDKFVIDSYKKINSVDIGFHLNRGVDSIIHRAKTLGLTKPNFKVNDNFFSEPNSLNSYWSGFIAADGYIGKNGKTLSISINKFDYDFLNIFRKNIEFTGLVNIVKQSKNAKGKEDLAKISINSKQIISDLCNNYNITNNKSLTLEPPKNLNLECSLAFITGLIDGDGCMNLKKHNGRPVMYILGTKSVLNWIKDITDNLFPMKRCSTVNSRDKYFSYRICGIRIIEFYKFIKPFNLPLMQRKWNKLEKFL